MTDLTVTLPAEPNVWAEVENHVERYRRRWVPGAFGRYTSISTVLRFRIIRAEWTTGSDGVQECTILEAEVAE